MGVAAVAAWAVLAAGCGAAEGVDKGATVAVYVSGPLRGPEGSAGRDQCEEAVRELQRHGARAGQVRVRLRCLDSAAEGGKWTLASVGANARRATEDSTTVAYIGEPSPRATRFSSTILEAAGIAQVSAMSGGPAMAKGKQRSPSLHARAGQWSAGQPFTGQLLTAVALA